MRWLVFFLAALNLLVFTMQTLEVQKRQPIGAQFEPKPIPEDAQSIMLLSEIKLVSEVAPAERQDQGSRPQSDPGDEALCFLVGPTEDPIVVERLQAALSTSPLSLQVHEKRVPLAPEYWVYLEPMESRKAAIIKLAEVQVRKIDSFLISHGSLRNGISLGLFRNREAALRIQAKRIEQGFEAKLTEIPRYKTEFWMTSEEQVNVQLLSRLEGAIGQISAALEVRQIFCKSVASGVDLP